MAFSGALCNLFDVTKPSIDAQMDRAIAAFLFDLPRGFVCAKSNQERKFYSRAVNLNRLGLVLNAGVFVAFAAKGGRRTKLFMTAHAPAEGVCAFEDSTRISWQHTQYSCAAELFNDGLT
eukprot:5246232-Pyramimonas_sp.AAC.1